MNEKTRNKLSSLRVRFKELQDKLTTAAGHSDGGQYKLYSKEFSHLEPLVTLFDALTEAESELEQATALINDSDPDIGSLAEEEAASWRKRVTQLNADLAVALYSKEPGDERSAFLEIRAGTGGDEAGLFVADLLRMYIRYSETCGFTLKVMNTRDSEQGGYKEVIAHVEGLGVYGALKFESGVHRVQRVPETESSGRLHTSACTVAVLAEAGEDAEIELDRKDIRVDTYRASGAGGQHVNKTDSAVRLTHMPTGVVVECQEERSQHKNRAKAMGLLKAKLAEQAEAARVDERAESRKKLIGSGDRSERIRTYNFPQNRVTDHRINLTLYKLSAVLAGELEHLITPLSEAAQAERSLAMIGTEAAPSK